MRKSCIVLITDSFCALTNIQIILASSKVESSCCRVFLLQQPELFHRLQEAWRRYHQSLDVKPEDLKDYFVRDRREMPADSELVCCFEMG